MPFLSGKQAFLQILKQEGVEIILKQRTLALKGFSAEDDRYVAMDLINPAIDFVGPARSLGVPDELSEETSDVAPALKRGLASGGPYLLDVRIDGGFKG